ncbi:hypothetical protein [Streptomyces sp. ALI-76-A]|jgi:hypothetical protein|uniref:hypothetical protein n=1 Tax=Streptomyces sp. ALI-76-A TaxID=3025736 RepID=UPI00256F1802|nr:hypothetical protein [Streptomyces sp. ALI-76-A]MDL5204942.1 hypothetical protein [Streptomyces sp. ALI-76-A]
MNVSGEWVLLGHGRPEGDVYEGPGVYAEIEERCHSWNEEQTARERRGEAPRGSLQRFYIKRVA